MSYTEEGARTVVTRLNSSPDIFCPLINVKCNSKCPTYKKAYVVTDTIPNDDRRDFESDIKFVYTVVDGKCTNPTIVGAR